MYRDLVEGRRWISEEDYKEGLALGGVPGAAGVTDFWPIDQLERR